MKRLLLASAAMVCAAAAHAQTQTFNSTSLAQWTRGEPWAPQGNIGGDMTSWWPGSAQTLPADADPIATGGGVLSLSVISRPADFPASSAGGANFIGSLVTTRNTLSQLYGYFQVQAIMSGAPGTMSAFWLNATSGSWPPEIDIVETLANAPTMLTNTIHSADSGESNNQTDTTVPDLTQGFHTYAVDWEADTITWYFDGVQTKQVATPSDMHQPMFMLLDTCSGTPGSWEGAPTSAGESGAMWVSSVEVWTSNPHLPPPPTPDAGTSVPAASTTTTIQTAAATVPAASVPAAPDSTTSSPASPPAAAPLSPATSAQVPDMTSTNQMAITAATQQAQADIAATQMAAAQAFASGQAQAQIQQLEQAGAPIAAQIQALQAWIASGQAPTADVLTVQPIILQPQTQQGAQ